VIPQGERLRRALLAPPVRCHDCKQHTGVECLLTLDTTYLPPPHGAAKADQYDHHYCLEYKPKVAAAAKVRCADCRALSYSPGPPEALACSYALAVNVQCVRQAERQCALFANRHTQEATS
jgi:hypothetical protein